MKKIRIILLVLTGVLVLGCIGVAVLFFATDIFKSNQELFAKSMSKVDIFEFADADFATQAINKMETNKYEDQGTFAISVQQDGTDVLGDVNIDFNSKNDTVNKLSESNININYQDQELLNINTVRNGDLYGLMIDDVLDTYLVIENKNLKDLFGKLGITDLDSIPNKIEENSLTEVINSINENKSELSKKYFKLILEQIPKENFTKAANQKTSVNGELVEATAYTLTINEADFYNIVIKVLETAREDTVIFDLTNKISSESITLDKYQQDIDDILNEFRDIANVDTDDTGVASIKANNNNEPATVSIVAYNKDR